MERTIRVTGTGNVSFVPDKIELSLYLSGRQEEYEKMMKQSSEYVSALGKAFAEEGFDEKELKTVSFNVSTEYENYQDENKIYCHRFVGYSFNHNLKFCFDADNALLSRALAAVTKSKTNPRFEISYTLKDEQAAKDILLKNAVEDSAKKAKLLAKAAGVELKEVLSIDYSWGEMEISSRPIRMDAMPLMEECADMRINPDDIDLSDTVTVVWGIE